MPAKPQLYELQVALRSGPVTAKFAKKNPVVERTIQIRSDQKLVHLHNAIFDAFDREDEHLFEFQVGARRPMDRKARRYVPAMAMDGAIDEAGPPGDVSRTTVGQLKLKLKQSFWYWFDFGDDWWHEITVRAIHDDVPKGRYPKVTDRTGDSPPQYIDWDEETDEDD